jgi:hypothetical protein
MWGWWGRRWFTGRRARPPAHTSVCVCSRARVDQGPRHGLTKKKSETPGAALAAPLSLATRSHLYAHTQQRWCACVSVCELQMSAGDEAPEELGGLLRRKE